MGDIQELSDAFFAPAPWVKPEPTMSELHAAIADLAGMVESLHVKVGAVETQLEQIVSVVAATVENVKPVLENLSGNPLLRMLGGKRNG